MLKDDSDLYISYYDFEKDNYMCQADYQMTMLSKIKVIRGKERWVQKLIIG